MSHVPFNVGLPLHLLVLLCMNSFCAFQTNGICQKIDWNYNETSFSLTLPHLHTHIYSHAICFLEIWNVGTQFVSFPEAIRAESRCRKCANRQVKYTKSIIWNNFKSVTDSDKLNFIPCVVKAKAPRHTRTICYWIMWRGFKFVNECG